MSEKNDSEEMEAILTDYMATKIVNIVNQYMLNRAYSIVDTIINHYDETIFNISDEEIYQFIIDLEKTND